MKARRCGFGVPFEEFDPVTRKALEDFDGFLRGELALAGDGQTYVELDDPRAAHFAPKLEVS